MSAPPPSLIYPIATQAVDIQLGPIKDGKRTVIISIDGRIALRIESCSAPVTVQSGAIQGSF